jgi:predicted dehydrogenase
MSTGRILIVGCGSIGERHLRNLTTLGESELQVVDPSPEARTRATALGARTYGSLEQGLATAPRGVLVCTPPSEHLVAVRAALAAGVHVFVEKPLSNDLAGAAAAVEDAHARGLVLAVGYNLRFHAGLRRLKAELDAGSIGELFAVRAEFGQDLSTWRPSRDYRQSYSAHRAEGGGILLDASHELDYVRWLGGEVRRVLAVEAHVSRLETDAEDVAALILSLSDGAIAEIHLDCVQIGYSRSCKLIGSEGTMTWDWTAGVQVRRRDGDQHFASDGDINLMYLEEMRHFLACVAGESEPLVSGADGLRALEIVAAARRSSAEGRAIAL